MSRSSRDLAQDLSKAEGSLREATRALADAEARGAVAVAAGKPPPDLLKQESRVGAARRAVRLVREALGLAEKAEQRSADATKEQQAAEAHEKVHVLARIVANYVGMALEAAADLRLEVAKASKLGAVSFGSGTLSPEAERTLAAWAERLRSL